MPTSVFNRGLQPPAETFFRSRTKRFRRYGKRARSVCPFHPGAEHQSLSMELVRGLYHCHACGASGDMVKFVMEQDGVDFLEAARRLGALVPVDDAEAQRYREKQERRAEEEQARQDAWTDHLERMAAGMETDEQICSWAIGHGHDDLVALANQSLELTAVEYLLAKAALNEQ